MTNDSLQVNRDSHPSEVMLQFAKAQRTALDEMRDYHDEACYNGDSDRSFTSIDEDFIDRLETLTSRNRSPTPNREQMSTKRKRGGRERKGRKERSKYQSDTVSNQMSNVMDTSPPYDSMGNLHVTINGLESGSFEKMVERQLAMLADGQG